MIISIHLADLDLRTSVSALRSPPRPDPGRGLRWSVAAVPLAIGHVPPRPLPGRVGLIAAWSDEVALDRFLSDHPWSENLAESSEVRLRPITSSGTWAALPELQERHDDPAQDESESVGVLTLGRLRASQAVRFLRASALAERPLLTHPARLFSIGLARPPLLATFSLWRTVDGMRDYAYRDLGGHAEASTRHKDRPFHHEAVFARLRPYHSRGTWTGAHPVAGTIPPTRS